MNPSSTQAVAPQARAAASAPQARAACQSLIEVLEISIGSGGTTFSDVPPDLSGTNGNYGGVAWVYRRAANPAAAPANHQRPAPGRAQQPLVPKTASIEPGRRNGWICAVNGSVPTNRSCDQARP